MANGGGRPPLAELAQKEAFYEVLNLIRREDVGEAEAQEKFQGWNATEWAEFHGMPLVRDELIFRFVSPHPIHHEFISYFFFHIHISFSPITMFHMEYSISGRSTHLNTFSNEFSTDLVLQPGNTNGFVEFIYLKTIVHMKHSNLKT
jgi:hypothetical protein